MSLITHIRQRAAQPVLTDVYGTARTLFALSTAATLLCNRVEELFPVGASIRAEDGAAFPWALFTIVDSPQLARLIAIASLVLVASGWRPRITGVLHAWISLSIAHTPAIIDGGEHVVQAFSILILPLTLLDGRKWHWQAPRAADGHRAPLHVFWFGVRLQACLIYFEAAVAKLGVEEWRNGTALYYWASDPILGAGPVVSAAFAPLLNSGLTLAVMTWGVILLEFVLAAALIASRATREVLLPLGISFHILIIFLHGITSFTVVMCSVLILYLRDPATPFDWSARLARLRGDRS